MSPLPTSSKSSDHIIDVAIVGAGPAGLAAAVALGRSLRSVTIIDAGQPRNRYAHAAHNTLGQEGISPAELLEKGRAEARSYGVNINSGRVEKVQRGSDSFAITLDDASLLHARRIILAHGAVDELPEIDGLMELWGTKVLHCPYCHGFEARGAEIVVLNTSSMSGHQALMFSQLSQKVTLVGIIDLEEHTRALLEKAGVKVVRDDVVSVAAVGDGVDMTLASGDSMQSDFIVVATRPMADDSLYSQLGGEMEEGPMGRSIPSSPSGRTPIEGVWAAGNAQAANSMVYASAAQGVMAGAEINFDLILADIADADSQ
ncbi:NAD(P)/FAD-dependent oxidoreductase [Corynebacterium crudilactis]|uniref:Thioredoxin reductase n=1 Tax=Corynebacterium crudilactis TaxID=1652495 RepID=A0A172QRP9_9CORY|nr:NAD(P)/FAD-dependent oxidoreductase [Corynebacterium crudilactis]ANE03359.1 thioredoxin reductase [Corynebacterium crudilactis]